MNLMKTEYLRSSTSKNQKTRIAASIVWAIRSNSNSQPGGRFLKQDPETKIWYEIGDKAAFRKTGQALRENSANFIQQAVSKENHHPVVAAVTKQTMCSSSSTTTTTTNPLRSSFAGLDAIAAAAVPI